MSGKRDGKLPELPQNFPHIFTEVVFQLIPEVDYSNLVYLSQLVRINRKIELYRPLTDALRKVQWAKLDGLAAIAFEKETLQMVEEGVIACNPVGQVQHAKTVFEFIMQVKSALDSIAVFLTEMLAISAKGGQRDFKFEKFRRQIISEDQIIGEHVESLRPWFINLQDLRDKWIHRVSARIFVTSPPSEMGLLPIPKVVMDDYKPKDIPFDKKYYWSTAEFTEFHLTNLLTFFGSIVKRCIEIELAKIAEPPSRPKETLPIIAFPILVTEDSKIKEIRYKW